ncbi:hypothetical protein EMIHUDRAFT_237450 [Emiliania huxleyi CCMP1516]|uniref:Auxin efflux carrier n=2 Tax=Emiliania huxleyi TaxID=2903 RepID=A0A0D3JPZ5_EMIH1|nr:hypothetical protein EMIHUDRAFT_237450 [Emiliania huxleyi CCMP1516]EOD25580.1 hypothetical protein EMIHUDRAFT_237450 [Emiliania huxleyi CCMP1516]|eukprot:XP_005778009.1 hypothetical protein EMIHUDRAFT_237450 [Emiliania huxleyi CCMP1516]
MPQPVTSYYCPGSLDTSAIFAIFIASLRAVSCAGAIVVAGLWMARRGVLTRGLSKGLSQFSVKLAIPCLLFTSVVPGVSPSLLALLLLVVLRPPSDFRLGTVAACAFYNTTSIPIILLSVLQQTLSRSIFAELASPLLFLSLQLLTYPLLQWLSSAGESEHCFRAFGESRRPALLRRIFIPSVLGICLGGGVGLFAKTLMLPPETAPLGWLFISASKLGEAAVPINLVLLGAALSRRPEAKGLPVATAVGIALARMVAMPLLGLVVAYGLTTAGARFVQPYVAVDPFWLVCLIVTCTPTANNIVVLCELAGENKHTMSAAIFYQYCAAPILLPGVLTLYVAFICHNRESIHGDMLL